jgi:hypothetical protein
LIIRYYPKLRKFKIFQKFIDLSLFIVFFKQNSKCFLLSLDSIINWINLSKEMLLLIWKFENYMISEKEKFIYFLSTIVKTEVKCIALHVLHKALRWAQQLMWRIIILVSLSGESFLFDSDSNAICMQFYKALVIKRAKNIHHNRICISHQKPNQ